MKKIISVISIILMVAMLLPICACAGSNDPETQSASTTKASTTEKTPTTEGTEETSATVVTDAVTTGKWLDSIPEDVTFEGENIVIAFADEDANPYTKRSLIVDEESTDPVDVAMFNRNKSVEERFGVTLEPIQVSTNLGGLQAIVNVPLAAGEDVYDIIVARQYDDIGMATKGFLLDLNRLDKSEENYLDVSKPYWGTEYINTITYKDYLYWVTGDINLRYIGGSYCTFVNKRMYDSTCTATFGDIYDIVKDKKWTFDMFTDMAQLAFVERDGNDMPSEGDDIGYVAVSAGSILYSVALCAGVEYSHKELDGKYTIALGNEKTDTFVSKFYPMMYSGYTWLADREPMDVFAEGKALFTINKVFQAESFLRNMEDDYYIVPVPMINEAQGVYISDLHNGVNLYGIAYTSEKVSACTAVLEALAAESYKSVTGVYYDQALKYKYTRDTRSAEMIDLIHNSVRTDFALAWTKEVGGISEVFGGHTSASTFSSALRKKVNSFSNQLTDLLKKLDNLYEKNKNQ